MDNRYDVCVIGGGPAGSTAALVLARTGASVCLVEKRRFPRETLCGEFLSHEVAAALEELGLEADFQQLDPNPIARFTFLPGRGHVFSLPLDFPAYGMPRGKFDHMLLRAAARAGVTVLQPAEVLKITRHGELFNLDCRTEEGGRSLSGSWVIGAYGKGAAPDQEESRHVAGRRTGFNGVKFHIPERLLGTILPDEILIAPGRGMYCGINVVGGGTATLCFLERRSAHDASPRLRIQDLVRQNPDAGSRIAPAALEFLREAPVYGTANITFGPRETVRNGVFMVGDAAGVIAPLAGDGIGIAVQQARLFCSLFARMRSRNLTREFLEQEYQRASLRLLAGRMRIALLCQRVMLSRALCPLIPGMLTIAPGLLPLLLRATRGATASHSRLKPSPSAGRGLDSSSWI